MMWGGKLLSGIKSMYVDSSACVRVKGGERFRIDNRLRQGCNVCPWLFYVYIDGVMKEAKMGMGRKGVSLLEHRREWRVPSLLFADDLVLCNESEEELRVRVGWFA